MFLLNGYETDLRSVSPDTTLLDFIRSRGLTGAKEGCAEGECGACAVLLVKEIAGRTAFVPVNSCLVLAPMVEDCEVYTVESLAASGKLAEVQQAMVDCGGSQCGYCTPGFVVSMFAEHSRAGAACDIHALGGNLCRCTGYRPIKEALAKLGPFNEGELQARLAKPVRALAAFDQRAGETRFSRPSTLHECLGLLAAHPFARLVAGNTDLGVYRNLRNIKAPHLISTEAIPELREFVDSPSEVEIGAALTLSEMEALWIDAPTLIRDWLPHFSSPLLRNRATLGGNLATASPIGDAAPMLLALDARVRIASPQGERSIPLHEFFLSYRQTALQPGEILRSIRIPKPFPHEAAFFKVAKRRFDDISTVAACIAMSSDSTGRIRNIRIALGGVAAIPLRSLPAEQALENTFGDDRDWLAAKAALVQSIEPISDHRGSAAYRVAVAQNLLDKFRYQRAGEAAA